MCRKHTISSKSVIMKENIHNNQYHQYLPLGHPWRGDITECSPLLVPTTEIIRWGHLREAFVLWGERSLAKDPARHSRIKHVSTLFSLPYWKVHQKNFLYNDIVRKQLNVILCIRVAIWRACEHELVSLGAYEQEK